MTSAEIAITVIPVVGAVMAYAYVWNERRKLLEARRKSRQDRGLIPAG